MKKYSYSRSERIADQIHKDIVSILKYRVKDPRIDWVTINDVEVTEDNSWATIYWTVLEEEKRLNVSRALESARGFIRSELSKGFKTYTIPQLKFVYDESLARGDKILGILGQVKQEFKDEE